MCEKGVQVPHLQQAQHAHWTELLYCCQTGPRVLPRMHAQLDQRIAQACGRTTALAATTSALPCAASPFSGQSLSWAAG